MLVISVIKRVRRKDHRFKDSLGYIVKTALPPKKVRVPKAGQVPRWLILQ